MKFEIKHRCNGSVLFSIEATSMKKAVESAVKSDADLAIHQQLHSQQKLHWVGLTSGLKICEARLQLNRRRYGTGTQATAPEVSVS